MFSVIGTFKLDAKASKFASIVSVKKVSVANLFAEAEAAIA